MIHKLKLERIEEGRAIFHTDDHSLVVWPLDRLPQGLEPGQSLFFEIKTSLEEIQADETLAKAVLNELLDTGK